MAEEEGKQISKYNEAVNQITRLHNLWLKCEGFKEKGLMDSYENSLRSAETELMYDTKKLSDGYDKDNERNYITKLNNIKVHIKICNNFIMRTKDSMFFGAALCKKWDTLIKKEELLREIQEEAGKGGVRTNPLEDDEID